MISTSLRRYLCDHKLPFREHTHQRCKCLIQCSELIGLKPSRVLRCDHYSDGYKTYQLITTLAKTINQDILEEVVGKPLTRLSERQCNRIFTDCESAAAPPVGEIYGLQCLIDREVLDYDRLYFSSGCHTSLVEMPQSAFCCLFHAPLYFESNSLASLQSLPSRAGSALSVSAGVEADQGAISNKLLTLYDIPHLVPVAQDLINIINRGKISSSELSTLIGREPYLQDRLIDYANSPLHQYPEKIDTLEQAINQVLGVELSSYLSLAMASAKAMNLPQSGEFCAHSFWRHSFLCAVLAQSYARYLPKSRGVLPGACYMSGLFHNFGIMLVAHLFPPEFQYLARLKTKAPKKSLATIEQKVMGMGIAQQVIGVGHAELGSCLLQYWNFPEIVRVVAAHHHQSDYEGKYQEYVHIVRLSNLLLANEGYGDELKEGRIEHSLQKLGLDENQVEQIMRRVMESLERIDGLSKHIAA